MSLAGSDFEFVTTHDALRTDDYLVLLDEYRRPSDGAQLILAHISVNRWAVSVFKRMRREWSLFRSLCTVPIYATPEEDTPKWRKFVTSLGFRPLVEDAVCNNGAHRPIFIHQIQDPDVPEIRTAVAVND